MPLTNQLHQAVCHTHRTVELKPFLARYKEPMLTLQDHYRHLCQLHAIYMLLEEKVASLVQAEFITLPDDLKFVLTRQHEIEKDLQFLEQAMSIKQRPAVLASTENYLSHLKKIDMDSESGKREILMHFLVRLLGDVFGGQKLKRQVGLLYKKRINSERDADAVEGVAFYHFQDGMVGKVKNWVNSLAVFDSDPECLGRYGNASFDFHAAIFDELESTRHPPSVLSQNSLFTREVLVAAGTATALFAGCITATYLLASNN